MSNFNENPHFEALDTRIKELLEELDNPTGNQEDYTATTNNLVKLMELRDKAIKTGNETFKVQNDKNKLDHDNFNETEKIRLDEAKIDIERDKIMLEEKKFTAAQETQRSWKPSPDAIVTAAASVVGILFVLHYEKLGVVTSKALGLVGKMK